MSTSLPNIVSPDGPNAHNPKSTLLTESLNALLLEHSITPPLLVDNLATGVVPLRAETIEFIDGTGDESAHVTNGLLTPKELCDVNAIPSTRV
ncbi:hypothetical protein PF002_g25403 [Phytophthora fragariae]|uniref:Uncharacterized protein n=1 Tax=Phytophthora fragariae TaxID=53985 RepID=A0A6A3RGP8_9STRA|nr:hypothetical protein PF003_g13739 [Phytophthora fragariae]KAE8924024.1 hypothetical protein PF009_g25739 [Phytophthora fragariae]KAE8978110.1 hypothetical protein PF011_g23383 [Phytophthora fragariae]KAE9095357.1 hypothetical protein PF006_g24036 [Phytophthora fragariae]KAE9183425.1 hypothetical protein PF004_g23951 [Phytophthora fragariae]